MVVCTRGVAFQPDGPLSFAATRDTGVERATGIKIGPKSLRLEGLQRGRFGLPGFFDIGASGVGSFSSFGLSLGR